MSGFALGLAFDSKSGQMVMVALLLTVGTFYAGTLFGNNDPIYVSELPSNSSSSSPSSFSTACRVHEDIKLWEYTVQRLLDWNMIILGIILCWVIYRQVLDNGMELK
ncbi:uncharacterized protein LOC126720267 [Quercus robur]|uniref:uncharacterized protein LOC126720267 n=1 Tax=Quercus robur TaxID=38942 RepID=UPI0021610C0F|nr:uncharacterized protein LOC126720267 [Quercus robur]